MESQAAALMLRAALGHGQCCCGGVKQGHGRGGAREQCGTPALDRERNGAGQWRCGW
jgi:hypothetical protein